MNNLWFTVGLPRSGKSTICKEWLSYDSSNIDNSWSANVGNHPRVVVCADDIRLSMGHRWNSYVEDFVQATKLIMIRTLLKKHDVIVDGTHTTKNSIIQLLNINPNAKPILIRTPPSVCIERAKSTGQDDLESVIWRMVDNLENLGGFDNIENTIEELKNCLHTPRIVD